MIFEIKVFLKQQELEQQHEKEYQIELDKKKVESEICEKLHKEKENHQKQHQQQQTPQHTTPQSAPIVFETKSASVHTNNPLFNHLLNQTKQRSSLGNIIANEKKSSPASNHTLSSNSNIFKSNNSTSPFVKYGQQHHDSQNNLAENELSKKLENRRQLIASQLSQTNNLQIDTNTIKNGGSLASSSNHSDSSSSSLSSPSVNSPSIPTKTQIKPTPTSFVMSAKFRTNYLPSGKVVAQQQAKLSDSMQVHSNQRSSLQFEENNFPLPPPPPMPPAMSAEQPAPVKSNNLPPVAPKNFKNDTLISINKKNQLLDARENLLESIKGFSLTNLRKVSQSD